jgi:hypothetical protein
MSYNPVFECMQRKQELIDNEKPIREPRLIPKSSAALLVSTDKEDGHLIFRIVYPEGTKEDTPPVEAVSKALAFIIDSTSLIVEED